MQTMAMKSIQIEIDDALFDAITNDKQIQAMGISEFFCRAAKFFLKLKTEYGIDIQFERAYGDPRVREEFDREMKEWIDEQA